MKLLRNILSPRMLKATLATLTISTLVVGSVAIPTDSAAQNFVVQKFQRRLRVGMGKDPAIGTIRYPQAIKDGETIVMFADGFDADGDDVFVEWYVQGRLFTIQSERPYGVKVGPDFYGHTPVRVTVAVRNDYGDSSVAKLAITSTAFSLANNCEFTSLDTAISVDNAMTTLNGNSGITISLEDTEEATGKKVEVTADLVISNSNAQGSLTLTQDGTSQAFTVSGEVEFESDGLTVTSLSVEDTDTGTKLSCN